MHGVQAAESAWPAGRRMPRQSHCRCAVGPDQSGMHTSCHGRISLTCCAEHMYGALPVMSSIRSTAAAVHTRKIG